MTAGISGSPGAHTAITNSYIGIMDNDQAVSQGIYFTDCGTGPLMISNNFIQAYGQGIYIESNGQPYCGPTPTSPLTSVSTRSYDDVTITHNSLYWPLSSLAGNAAWDGLSRVSPRNQIEAKIGRRWLIQGNLINGQWAGQTEGEAIAMTPTTSTTINGESGSMDWTINFNLFTKVALLMTFSGTRNLQNPGPPDPSITTRALVSNNYAYSIGKNLYSLSGIACNSGPCGAGIGPGYFASINSAQDLTFINNTWPYVSGDRGSSQSWFYPTWWSIGGPPLMGGLTWLSNIQSFDGGGVSPAAIFASTDAGCCPNFSLSPNINTTSNATIFSTEFINVSSSGVIQNAYNWGHNIVIPGWYGNAGTPWTQMTDAQASALAASSPTGDTYVTSGGANTIAARLANAGVPGLDSGNPTCTAMKQNPCAAGVNLQGLESALGIVSNIIVRPGTGALQFSYTAPDSKTCSVDTSPNGTTWTRTTDSGGSRSRTALVSSLSANTTYLYMVECYYSQTGAWFAAPWDGSNLVTDGVSATTAISGTRTLPISFTLPIGASAAQFTVTGVGGSPIVDTCSSSPCSIPGVPNGSVLVQIAYMSSGGNTISSGSVWTQ
jgi:hypothetical protein